MSLADRVLSEASPSSASKRKANAAIRAGAKAMAKVFNGQGEQELAHALEVKLYKDLVAMADEQEAYEDPEKGKWLWDRGSRLPNTPENVKRLRSFDRSMRMMKGI